MSGQPKRQRGEPRTLRAKLTLTLVVVALISFIIIAGLNFLAAQELLASGAQNQLAGIGQARARSIEAGAARVQGQVSAIAGDLAVTQALEELTDGYNQLEDELDPQSQDRLDDYYQEQLVDPIEEAGLGPVTAAELEPPSPAGRYLQFHYTLPAADGTPPREVVDAGDGSAYSQAHAESHDYLAQLSAELGGGDLLLISADGDIVYSVEKSTDFGASLTTGSLAESALASTATEELARVAAGEAVLADWEIYLPAGGRPSLFVLSAVRRDTEFLGALAVQIESEALSTITTANQQWEAVGLGSGESYVVGPDLLLRSESRQWLEDPQSYLDAVDDDLAELIEIFGSPVGLQPVNTAPVRAALDGEEFNGTSDNYLGQSSFSSAIPIDLEGVQWVVVVDTPLDEARAELNDYLRRMALVLVILLALTALFGYGLAVRLAKPIPPLASAARAVAEGDRDPDIADLGRDELGDLGRRLQRTAAELGHQEEELEAEFERKRSMLLSVLPARLVNPRGEVGESAESVEVVTAIAAVLNLEPEGSGSDDDALANTLVEIAEQVSEDAAEQHIEPVRLAADRYLFLAGVGSSDEGADAAIDFAVTLAGAARERAALAHASVTVHIGLATGPVATGVLDGGSLTFGAWGEPVRRALAIAALSRSDELLVDMTTAEVADRSRFTLEPAQDIVSLDGAPLPLMAHQFSAPTSGASATDARPSPG